MEKNLVILEQKSEKCHQKVKEEAKKMKPKIKEKADKFTKLANTKLEESVKGHLGNLEEAKNSFKTNGDMKAAEEMMNTTTEEWMTGDVQTIIADTLKEMLN